MKLSIIVCTFNRAYALTPCLDSLSDAIANTPSADAEIVIVDNASSDSTAELLNEWSFQRPFPVQILYEAKKGLASARNCGIRAAKGDIIVFTDDDCRMDKDYINDLYRHYAQDKEPVMRGGRIELGDKTDLPLTIKTDRTPMRWDHSTPSSKYALMGGEAICGCNMAMPRTVIDRLGVFDERLGAGTSIPGGENTDYYVRAYLAGIAVEYVPDMLIHHWHGRKSTKDAHKLVTNYTISNGALYAKYLFKTPHLCRGLYWDARNCFKELLKGQNSYLPDWNFSFCDKFVYVLKGMLKFALVSITKNNAND